MLDPLWCAWFTGLVDGEGYFQLNCLANGDIEVGLVIQLREDDVRVLDEIHRTLGIGRLYHVSEHGERAKGVRKSDKIRWVCRKKEEIAQTLIPLFDQYPLRSKKGRDYAIWREVAILQYRNEHLTDDGRKHSFRLVEQLKAIRGDTPYRQMIGGDHA